MTAWARPLQYGAHPPPTTPLETVSELPQALHVRLRVSCRAIPNLASLLPSLGTPSSHLLSDSKQSPYGEPLGLEPHLMIHRMEQMDASLRLDESMSQLMATRRSAGPQATTMGCRT